MIPAPTVLTEEEFIANNGSDIELEKWCKYSSPFGFLLLLIDKLLNKEIK